VDHESFSTHISPLRSPGFDGLHAALFTESRTRGRRQQREAGNPGTLRSRNISKKRPLKPQISPLRSFGAPVEMTKGRAALPLSVVAEQKPLFITLG
jgi:hypothetical protein